MAKRLLPFEGRLTRAEHEQFAAEDIADADRKLRDAHGCDPGSVRKFAQGVRAVGSARAHLVSIGGHEGKRTKKLWGAVSRVEKLLAERESRITKCASRGAGLSGTKKR